VLTLKAKSSVASMILNTVFSIVLLVGGLARLANRGQGSGLVIGHSCFLPAECTYISALQ
jgi:hypothetical protein